MKNNYVCKSSLASNSLIFIRFVPLKYFGNNIWNLIIKSPLVVGFFDNGIPSPIRIEREKFMISNGVNKQYELMRMSRDEVKIRMLGMNINL